MLICLNFFCIILSKANKICCLSNDYVYNVVCYIQRKL